MADDFAALNRKLGELVSRLDGPSMRELTTKMATRTKRVLVDGYRDVLGPDMRMSNWHRGQGQGVKIGVGYDLVSDHEAAFRPRPSGPAKTLEDGSLPHLIESKPARIVGKGASRARRQQSLARAFNGRGAFSGSNPMTAGSTFAFRVRHPGSKGHRVWSKSIDRVDRSIGGWLNDELGPIIGRSLGQ